MSLIQLFLVDLGVTGLRGTFIIDSSVHTEAHTRLESSNKSG